MSLDIGKVAVALGALLAYQNRDKIGDLLRGSRDPDKPQDGGLLETLTSGGGLQDILDRFRGTGSAVDSWVGPGENEPLPAEQVKSAISPETLDQLVQQTGLTREELIERITRDLPKAVDALTPDGRVPDIAAQTPESAVTGGGLLDDVPPYDAKTQA